MDLLRRFGTALLRAVYPRRAVCMGCGAASGCLEDWLCPECRMAMARAWVGACPPPKGIDAAACAYVYAGPAAGLVQRLKYSGVRSLAGCMGRDMARALRLIEPTSADCITAVPMHPRRLRRRGYNHAALLARDVAARVDLPFVEALDRVRDTPQQARLDEAQRRHNQNDAFAVRMPVKGRVILLVDDVCTTGSTARACAKALRKGGAKRVYLLCYCLTPKK